MSSFDKCVEHFTKRQYELCVQTGMALVGENALDLEWMLSERAFQSIRLVAISLQRTGQFARYQEWVASVMDIVRKMDPWSGTLYDVAIGQVSARDMEPAPADMDQTCSLRYYEGAGLLTVGDKLAASRAFRCCLECDSDCLERRLAQNDLAFLEAEGYGTERPQNDPNATKWYYSTDGRTGKGPVSSAALRRLIHERRVLPSSKVSRDGRKWHYAYDLKGVDWPV